MARSGTIGSSRHTRWRFAWALTVVFSPIVLWGSWETISTLSTVMKVLACAAILGITHLGCVALLWWNDAAQKHWKKNG